MDRRMLYLFGAGIFAFTSFNFTNCSKVGFGVSPFEAAALKSSAFSDDGRVSEPEGDKTNPQYNVAGVDPGEGLPTENLRVTTVAQAASHFVKDCTQPIEMNGVKLDRKIWERAEAIRLAADDPTQKTVPVEYAISFGQKEDRLAYWAHKRAVLSGSNPGYTVLPVGPKNASAPKINNVTTHAYYKANHDLAKEQYIKGERCFYSTVQIASNLIKNSTSVKYDFIESAEPGTANAPLRHTVHYMYYGWCNGCALKNVALYGVGSYAASGAPNRLFDVWPHSEVNSKTGIEEPQFIKLFIADLRDGQFRLGAKGSVVKVPEDTIRGHEAEIDVRDTVNLPLIFKNFGQAIRTLSAEYKSPTTNEVFSGMVGMPQLLSNLNNLSISGTLLSSQYTPLVFDLGEVKVRTTSTSWGTFFNMSLRNDLPHRTAWLGGELHDVAAQAAGDSLGFQNDFRRLAEDGFLVLPNADGSVTDSRNLFGDSIELNGKTYANGFDALRTFAGKDCTSTDFSQRYLGPWDGDIFNSKLRVWIDRDRNGHADANELKSLPQTGILAINTCYIVHTDDKDTFGNGTAWRSTFLLAKDSVNKPVSSAETLQILQGSLVDADRVEFRLFIDLLFQVKADDQLVNVN